MENEPRRSSPIAQAPLTAWPSLEGASPSHFDELDRLISQIFGLSLRINGFTALLRAGQMNGYVEEMSGLAREMGRIRDRFSLPSGRTQTEKGIIKIRLKKILC